MGSETDPGDQRIGELTQLLAAALSRIEIAKKRVAELETEVARLRQDLSNSSKPPSSDLLGVERGGKAPTGRARGGQPGHKHHKRELLPDEQVSKVVDWVPEKCGQCEVRLEGKDAEPRRTQVIEVPLRSPSIELAS